MRVYIYAIPRTACDSAVAVYFGRVTGAPRLPASRLLAADLAGSGLGASTSATELAAKTVPAMVEVIAFPTRLCWSSHAHMWARPQHNRE